MEYRISEDYGKTWGDIYDFPYSKQEFFDGIHSVSVEKAVACDDGSIVVFCHLNTIDAPASCEPYDIPKYVISKDGGKSWSEAKDFSSFKGRIYDAVYYNKSIYVLEFCNDAKERFTGTQKEHLYRIFKSDDNGASFYELSIVGFPKTLSRAYGNMVFSPEGKLMVYAYNEEDEKNMEDYLKAGVCGFGIGSNIVNKNFIKEENYGAITRLAKEYTKVVEGWACI